MESCPSVANGYVYVGSWDGNVYCLDATTGAKIWNYSTGGLVESSPAVVGDHVYVASQTATFIVLMLHLAQKFGTTPLGTSCSLHLQLLTVAST